MDVPVLERLEDANGECLLSLPWEPDEGEPCVARVRGEKTTWPCTAREILDTYPEGIEALPPPRWFTATPAAARPALRVSPSALELCADLRTAVRVEEVVRLGDRPSISVDSSAAADLGTAVHGFLAADLGDNEDRAQRRALAAAQLSAHGFDGSVDPHVVLDIGDRFAEWLARRTAGAPPLREWPVSHLLDDGRFVRGEIDLLAPHPDGGFMLLDHKTFPGDERARDERLRDYAAQLGAYAAAITAATGAPVREVWVHLPLRGEVVRVGGVAG